MKEYKLKFYGRGLSIYEVYVFADSELDAIRKTREKNSIIEMIYCKEVR